LFLIPALLMAVACRNEVEVTVPPPPAPPPTLAEVDEVPARDVRLWFESESRRLAPETRKLLLPASDAEALKPLLQALLEKTEENDPRPVPDGIEVRAAYLLPDGTAIVDLGGTLFQQGWKTGSDAEVMLVYSVVQTATDNLSTVSRVQFLINGHPADTLAGHVSIEHPLRPIRSLVAR
jgi:hypothetical protein